MGLDNGLYLHTRKDMKDEPKPNWLELEYWEDFEDKTKGEWEIAYWRKNYGVRDLAFEIFSDFENCSPSELKKFSKKLCEFLTGEREWNAAWELGECFNGLAYQIAAISWAADWLEQNSNSYVEFVDSY